MENLQLAMIVLATVAAVLGFLVGFSFGISYLQDQIDQKEDWWRE